MNLDWLSAYLIYALFTVVGTIGLAQLLHLQMGLAGIGNFGIVGFFGLGMYAYGVFLVRVPWPESWGVVWPFLISLVAAAVVSYLAGLLIGWLIADLEGDGVLVGTLGFATIIYHLSLSEKVWTGGAEGMAIPSPSAWVRSRTRSSGWASSSWWWPLSPCTSPGCTGPLTGGCSSLPARTSPWPAAWGSRPSAPS